MCADTVQVSVETLLKLFKTLRQRIPGKYLPLLGIEYASLTIAYVLSGVVMAFMFRRNLRDLIALDDERELKSTHFLAVAA